jgi:hypothetical protein
MVDFYGIFTSIAFRQRFALTEVAKYTSVISNTGRFDYISIMMILGAGLISTSLPLFFSSKILNYVFNFKKCFIAPLITTLITFILIVFFGQYYYSFEKISTSCFMVFYLVFNLLLPVAVVILTKRRKTNEPS